MTTATTMSNDDDEMFPERLSIIKLSKELKQTAKRLSVAEVRYLVDAYYTLQADRIRANHQIRCIAPNEGLPPPLVTWLAEQCAQIERQVQGALHEYVKAKPIGKWLLATHGIGPVISAGLMAHVNIEKAPTVGHIWRFAGLDPTVKWLGTKGAKDLVSETGGLIEAPWGETGDPYAMTEKELEEYQAVIAENPTRLELDQRQMVAISRLTNRRFGNLLRLARDDKGRVTKESMTKALAKRPWNASLKVLCWKTGESFVKVSGNEKSQYGFIYKERKALETKRNEQGLFAEQAKLVLETKKIGKSTDAYKAYSQGKLPPAHIHARSTRYTVKLFLSHLHEEMYREHFGKEPPLPYPIAHLGHAHKIEHAA